MPDRNKMTNPMASKSPEERRAIAAKSHATRRLNREAEEKRRRDDKECADELKRKIRALERRLAALSGAEAVMTVAAKITGKALLGAEEIARAALPWSKASGVYFLLFGDEVVYVGQAVNVYARIGQHSGKRFDRYAFVPCDTHNLDALESLYIHLLSPKLNGVRPDGAKCAPISLDQLLSICSQANTGTTTSPARARPSAASPA